MQITLTLTDDELKFLQKMLDEEKDFGSSLRTLEDMVHDCIKMAMFDESETQASEEGM